MQKTSRKPVQPAPGGADGIVAAIAEAIGAGRLPAGAHLGEEQIAQSFSVGRTLAREALRGLAHIGMVELQPNRGAFVARPTRRDAEDLYAARRLVEGAIAEDVAMHATAHDVRALRAHVQRQRDAEAAGQRRQHVRLLGEFHLQLARLGGNRVLEEMLVILVARTSLILSLFATPQEHCAADEHDQLIERIAAGDAAGARDVILHHLSPDLTRIPEDPPEPQRVDLAAALGLAGG